MATRFSKSERGSAVVEFVLVSTPLMLVSVTVIAMGLSSFALSVMRDSAIEGARFAALADQDSASGCLRAEQLANRAIGALVSITATCELVDDAFEVVELKAQMPLVGLMPGAQNFVVSSKAPREN